MKKNFEEFLREEHAKDYHGTDDDMPDAFDAWVQGLQADEWLAFGDAYRTA